MRLVFLLAAPLALAACTEPNPGFVTGGSASVGSTGSTGSNPTSTGTTDPPTTTTNPSTSSTTLPETTGTTDPLETTDPSSGTTVANTGPDSSSTADPGSSSGDPLPVCDPLSDTLVPFLQLLTYNNAELSPTQCDKLATETLTGEFKFQANELALFNEVCPTNLVKDYKLTGQLLELPQDMAGFKACVTVELDVHPIDGCYVQKLKILEGGKAIVWGEFGIPSTGEVTNGLKVDIPLKPDEPCGCFCCDQAPGLYAVTVNGTPVLETDNFPPFTDPNDPNDPAATFAFKNYRSHVHDACVEMKPEPLWRHFDWMFFRLKP